MKHKLIMENWRRFVNESDDLSVALNEYSPEDDQLEEVVGATLALLMGLWSGMSGADNSLQVVGLDGDRHEISYDEYQGVASILEKVSGGDYAEAVDQSTSAFRSVDPNGAGPTAGVLDLRNLPSPAGNMLDKVFDAVDQPDPPEDSPSSPEQPGGEGSTNTINADGMLKMLKLKAQMNPEEAKAKAQEILDTDPAGMSDETKAGLEQIANLR